MLWPTPRRFFHCSCGHVHVYGWHIGYKVVRRFVCGKVFAHKRIWKLKIIKSNDTYSYRVCFTLLLPLHSLLLLLLLLLVSLLLLLWFFGSCFCFVYMLCMLSLVGWKSALASVNTFHCNFICTMACRVFIAPHTYFGSICVCLCLSGCVRVFVFAHVRAAEEHQLFIELHTFWSVGFWI